MPQTNKEINWKQQSRPNNTRTEIPANHLLQDIKKISEQVDGSLTLREYREHGRHSYDLIQKHFNTWNTAKQEAGLTNINPMKGNPKHSQEDILNDIKNVAEKLGQDNITLQQYKKHGSVSRSTVRRRFGSWTQAKNEAGLNPPTTQDRERQKQQEILEDIRHVNDQVFGELSKREYDKHGQYSEWTTRNEFGSWTNAKRRALQKQ